MDELPDFLKTPAAKAIYSSQARIKEFAAGAKVDMKTLIEVANIHHEGSGLLVKDALDKIIANIEQKIGNIHRGIRKDAKKGDVELEGLELGRANALCDFCEELVAIIEMSKGP